MKKKKEKKEKEKKRGSRGADCKEGRVTTQMKHEVFTFTIYYSNGLKLGAAYTFTFGSN